jgi:hypothetical protein
MKKFLAALIIVFGIVSFALFRHFIPDDTFIHVGYAKDIIDGKGYSFAGNRTYGSTAPLWPLLIAAITLATQNLVVSARLLSTIFAMGSLIFMFYTAKLRFSAWQSFAAVILLTVNTYFMRWALTGMEASAAVFFMITLVFVLFKENDNSSKRSAYFLIGFSPLVRPEFYLILSLFFLYMLAVKGKTKFDFIKLVLTAIPGLCWLSFAEIYYGTIVPTTFLAKAGGPFFSMETATLIRNLKLFLSQNFVEISFILIATVLLLKIRQEKSSPTTLSSYDHPIKRDDTELLSSERFLFVVIILSFFCFYSLKDVVIISRYSLMLVPLIILMAVDLANQVEKRWNYSHVRMRYIWVVLVGASTLYNFLFTVLIAKPDADRFYEGFQKHYIKIASMLKRLNTGDCHVAVSDVGIIGVYSGCFVDDLNGLVDKNRFNYRNKENYLEAKKPEFLILRGEVDVRKLGQKYREIYSTTIPGFGINATQDCHIQVYQICSQN